MNKLRVAVLFGGPSVEHEVSLNSAYNVIKNLIDCNFDVYPIGITKKGEWYYYYGDIEKIKTKEWEQKDNCRAVISSNPLYKGILKIDGELNFKVLEIDCAFAVVHGAYGEDGKLSGLFEMAKIPYVGCNVLSSSCAMNKIITHIILEANDIKGTKWKALRKYDLNNLDVMLKKIASDLSFPIFTKPASCGSSVGIAKCCSLDQLKDGVELAFKYDYEVICEAYIEGKEVECAVFGLTESPKASILGQIESCNDFYDYESKYEVDSKLIIPANLDETVTKKVREIAVKAFKVLGCSGLSRVDFFVDSKNEIYLNEINTMPGFTNISMYTKLWEKTGMSYKELLKGLIYMAIEKKY